MNFKIFNPLKSASYLLLSLIMLSCNEKSDTKRIAVKNELDFDRMGETVSIPADKIDELLEVFRPEDLLVRDMETKKEITHQWMDSNSDGKIDQLIFQVNVGANEERLFSIGKSESAAKNDSASFVAYSRFVPERIDDYAWENDRVAFRTYGPEAQRLTENKEKGGTLTSGIDAWFKKVEYPVIDKWYAENLENPGAYHKDTGEGYDPYHVGASRGIGGIGVWHNDSLYVSKNFVEYKVIANGPIRTVFELTYAPWQVEGITIKEIKRISLDLGSNLSRFEIGLETDKPLPGVTIGITLHDKSGSVKVENEKGWFRYWETIDGAALGTGIVIDPSLVQGYNDYRTPASDQSHLFVHTLPENVLTYYAGFAWEKSGQFKSQEEWDQYLNNFSRRLDSPLIVNVY